jgi:hypothetical protein
MVDQRHGESRPGQVPGHIEAVELEVARRHPATGEAAQHGRAFAGPVPVDDRLRGQGRDPREEIVDGYAQLSPLDHHQDRLRKPCAWHAAVHIV